jgi:hypothetical protein
MKIQVKNPLRVMFWCYVLFIALVFWIGTHFLTK